MLVKTLIIQQNQNIQQNQQNQKIQQNQNIQQNQQVKILLKYYFSRDIIYVLNMC